MTITITTGAHSYLQPGDRITFHSFWPMAHHLRILRKPRRKSRRLKVRGLIGSYRITAVNETTLVV